VSAATPKATTAACQQVSRADGPRRPGGGTGGTGGSRLAGGSRCGQADQAGYGRGRGGGQEDRQPGRHVQRGARDRQAIQRGPAQMTDDRGIGQAVGGFGRDRPEGGQRENRDAPVQDPVGGPACGPACGTVGGPARSPVGPACGPACAVRAGWHGHQFPLRMVVTQSDKTG
jgi:hypothetical protein